METPSNKKDRSSIFDKMAEAIGWLQIVASPMLIGVGIAAGLYYLFPHPFTVFIAIAIVVIAFVCGAKWATNIARKRGTIQFLSGTNSSPELNKQDDEL